MSRPRKGTRVHLDKKSGDWFLFHHDGRRKRLGLRGEADRAAANAALADVLIEERLGSAAPRLASSMPVMDAVYLYAEARHPHVAKPQLLADAIQALSPFWTGKTIADVNRRSCEEFSNWRMKGGLRRHQLKTGKANRPHLSKEQISRSTARRDLTTLRAALRFVQSEGVLIGEPPKVHLPPETSPRERVLSRSECAMILHELWRGAPTRARDGSTHRSPGKTRHAARLFWLLLYTGSRFQTVAQTTRCRRSTGPWIDLANGLWHRRGADELETVKRRDAHRIPGRIILALARWERAYPDQKYVVERPSRPGLPIADIGQALDGACRRLGIGRITAHTIKHTSISLFISGGGDPVHAAEYYSTSLQTILKNYLHLSPKFQDGAMPHVSRLGRRVLP